MNIISLLVVSIFILINFLSFSIMIYDKNLAIKGRRRISEGALFFLAILFGGLGVYFGMLLFRHKTQKWYFYFGIPLLLIQNLGCLFLIYQVISGYCFSFKL